MKPIDLPKLLFYLTTAAIALGIAFAFGLYSGASRNAVFEAVRTLKQHLEQTLIVAGQEFTTLTKIRPEHFLQPARGSGEGVTINRVADDGRLVLLAGFFETNNELRLVRRDGTPVARWPVAFHELFPDTSHIPKPPATDWNTDIHGALVLPDGSVVFNFDYHGLVKLDRCGRVTWTLNVRSHHSVERAAGGGFWVPGRTEFPAGSASPYPPFIPPYGADVIMRVSDDGRVLEEIPVPQLFYDNGLETLLTSNGEWMKRDRDWDHEIVHLNKIAELPASIAADFVQFEAGDLALSFRTLNLLMVVDPESRDIRWIREGPWLRQHDPEFRPGGTIVVFNNNTFATTWPDADHTTTVSPEHYSNIIEIDPATDEHRVIYGNADDQAMLTVIRGKLELTDAGGLLITEFEGGRVFETDAGGQIVWEYINRYDEDEVAEISEARLYAPEYFDVPDWTCGD